MHHGSYQARPVVSLLGTYPAEPGPALHLLAGVWVASCPSCGYQLATARIQERCERRAAGRVCPVCHQDDAA
jgi:hypothetical protein